MITQASIIARSGLIYSTKILSLINGSFESCANVLYSQSEWHA